MSISSDGHISYGYLMEDDTELPWGDDLDNWWRKLNGYVPPFEIYSDSHPSGYVGGKKPPQNKIDEYFDHRNAWDKDHPLPVEEVNSQSYDYPLWILAVPGTYKSVSRGYPESFEPSELKVDAAKLSALDAFIAAHNIKPVKGPAWFLGSLYG